MGKYTDAARRYETARLRRMDMIAGYPGHEVREAVNQIIDLLKDDGDAYFLIKEAVGDEGIKICTAECSHDTLGTYFIAPRGIVFRFLRDGKNEERPQEMGDLVAAMLDERSGLKLKNPGAAVAHIKRLLDKLVEDAPK